LEKEFYTVKIVFFEDYFSFVILQEKGYLTSNLMCRYTPTKWGGGKETSTFTSGDSSSHVPIKFAKEILR